ncbi:MAG: anti-sigma factor [Burkholderiaceae bacterium]|nr:anti-sigma factor [Burkholderiaceae bacterium]MDO9089777.1 anti-sigma factor [Burkholderiaceae bacterium]MDP1968163.1 anti-sigma factor [Burkholderiaceae bacterium]
MRIKDTSPIDDAQLHALVDGHLSPASAVALEARIAHDPQAAATVQAWRAQRDALRALHADMLHEPVPPGFMATAVEGIARGERAAQWWRWGGMAASVLMAFGLGWSGRAFWSESSAGAARLATAEPVRSFARQASAAHAVYLPEVRHPVEVPAAQQEHLVQWLSKRLGRPLKVPALAGMGYELVGGRLLPGEDGARAQFMYQNAAGERITLYLGAVKAGTGPADKGSETAFRFTDAGAVPTFYWVDQGFGYALAGKLSRPALLGLATAVHQQL